MINKTLELDHNTTLKCYTYSESYPNNVTLEYIERQAWTAYGDTETEVEITKEKAIEIIDFLVESHNLEDMYKIVSKTASEVL